MKINYSIIIPHKNIPNLLQRCLDSIPKRDDVQIIVVDDNSDPSIVDFDHFPGMGEKCVEVYFTKEGKGAGYARNIGLKYAQGKWILFVDADDFFNYCLKQFLEDYKDSAYDCVFFNANSLDSELYCVRNRAHHLNKYITNYTERNKEKAALDLRFTFGEPWCKMVKSNIVVNNNIKFSETSVHNDTKYSYLVGFFSQNMHVDKRCVYCVTDRIGSISKSMTEEKLFIQTYIFSEATVFFHKHNIRKFGIYTFNAFTHFLLKGDIDCSKRCLTIMKSCGMSESLIAYGFSMYILKLTTVWPYKVLRKLFV